MTLQFVSRHIPVYLYIFMNTCGVSHARIADVYIFMSVRDACVREYAHTCVFTHIYEYIWCLTCSYCSSKRDLHLYICIYISVRDASVREPNSAQYFDKGDVRGGGGGGEKGSRHRHPPPLLPRFSSECVFR